MRVSIISVILLTGLFSSLPVKATEIELQNNRPERHIVVSGDTLWGIASRFLKDPWLWPQLWGLNQEQVKNPHKIYPGDIIVLEQTPDGSRLRLARENSAVVIKLSPRIRTEKSDVAAIPSVPAAAIEPFLGQPLVIEKNGLADAPLVLGTSDSRVILNAGDIVYASGLPKERGSAWQVFRSGKALMDPDDSQILGYEAVYLGDAKVEKFGDVSALSITRSVEEILKGDRLVPTPAPTFNNYAPHAPDKLVKGRIISVYGGVSQIGKGSIVTLSKGARDGLEAGHVLAVYRKSQTMSPERRVIQLPDERAGLVFVFRVFEKAAYALVMQSTQPIQMLDAVQTP